MRYSKKKKITIAIISVFFVLLIGFVIFKGITDSMKLTDNTSNKVSKPKVSASISLTKLFKGKKETKTETKKDENKVLKSAKDKTEEKTSKVKEVKEDNSIAGSYVITDLKIGDKKYTKDEIKKLKENGYSLSLDVKSDGSADLSVLYISKLLSYDNENFSDGQNEYKYTKSWNKIKLKIDNAEMTFKKE